jgi:ribosomal protein S18 acetylase RimI-like enzyme
MSDLDRLVDLWLALATDQREHGSTIESAANDDAVRESLAQHVLAEGVLVARDAGSIVGFVMFGPDESGFERDRARGVVRNIYVVPEARGSGYGSALLSTAEERLAAAGAEVVVLEAMAANEAARRFYRDRGYEPHRVQLHKPVESDTPTS